MGGNVNDDRVALQKLSVVSYGSESGSYVRYNPRTIESGRVAPGQAGGEPGQCGEAGGRGVLHLVSFL